VSPEGLWRWLFYTNHLKVIYFQAASLTMIVGFDRMYLERKKMSKKITIIWGTDKEDKKSYTFEKEQLKYFMMGVDEANGWLEYEIEEN
jgi:hypothetical protein